MAERDLNDRLRAALAGWDPVRVENAVGVGTPDINYVSGWIESKQLPEWPKRPETPVRVEHYVPAQRGWHVKRTSAGGRVHVVIEVADTVMVFDARLAAQFLGDWTKDEMLRNALLVMRPWDKRTFRAFIQECDKSRYSLI